MNVEDSVVGMVAFAMGVLAILGRRSMASYILASQKELWGLRFGARSEATTSALLLAAGVVVATCGIAVLVWGAVV